MAAPWRGLVTCWLIPVLLLNAGGYALAWHDKRRAVHNRSNPAKPRTRERTFILLALLGGGLGTYAAFLLHRHKTRKRRFLVPFIAAMLAGAVLVGAMAAIACAPFI